MRNIIFFMLLLLLGMNALLLWQNREIKQEATNTCCDIPDNMDIRLNDVKTSLLPGILGLIP